MRLGASFCAAFVSAALLAGCSDPAATQPANDILGGAGVAMDIDTYAAENMESPANIAAPSLEPGPDDARTVVMGYFDALAAGRYDQAYAVWEPGAAGMDASAFAESFAKYRTYKAEVGVPGRVDAGAGQRYVTVPARVTAILADGGEKVTMIGPVTLHRTGMIDGTGAAQRSWRIRDTAMKPRPLATPVADRPAQYRCDDGLTFTVQFNNEADTAAIAIPDQAPVVLSGQRPASGIWYAADGWELRGKGDAATLSRPDEGTIGCTAD